MQSTIHFRDLHTANANMHKDLQSVCYIMLEQMSLHMLQKLVLMNAYLLSKKKLHVKPFITYLSIQSNAIIMLFSDEK